MPDLICECGFLLDPENESELVCPACGDGGGSLNHTFDFDLLAEEAALILQNISDAPLFINGNDLIN